MKAEVLMVAGRKSEAIEAYRKCMEVNPASLYHSRRVFNGCISQYNFKGIA